MTKLFLVLVFAIFLLGNTSKITFGVQSRCTQPGMFTLTFDDGVSENFKAVLDILEKEKVKATFFVIGSTLLNPHKHQLLKKAYDQGHTIGNHTWTHPWLTKISEKQLEKEVGDTQNGINAIAPNNIKFIRPPFGAVNQKVYSKLNKMGYTVVTWNLDTMDWNVKNNKDRMRSKVIPYLNQKNSGKHSYILLQHDRRLASVELVPEFIKAAKLNGYRVVSLQECLGMI
jgi:peptidoglycan/xylan/chitin deacetylase (PgdA/CDA1 family)